jgi:hypothetical protein
MSKSRVKDVAIRYVLLPIIAICAMVAPWSHGVSVEPLPGATVTLPSLISAASQRIAANVRAVQDGRHLGFDTNIYPGDKAMLAWRSEDSPYEWVGYYLPAPCHRDTSWAGKRTQLQAMGWGMAVIYVGQQAWGKMGHTTRSRSGRRRTVRSTENNSCSSNFVNGTRGAADAADAIARTTAEGFPKGTTIFLDVERVDIVPSSLRSYYRAWTAAVLADGTYRPGVYAHTDNAGRVYDDVRAEFVNAGDTREPQFWVAGRTRTFSPDKAPSDVGHSFADVWQGRLDVFDTQNGVRLPIDISVARVPSPSQEYALGE